MAGTENLNRIIIKYRTLQSDLFMASGEEYTENNIASEATEGQGAQSNQEIANLAVDAVNIFINALADVIRTKATHQWDVSFAPLASIIPEYVELGNDAISFTSGNYATRNFSISQFEDTDKKYAYPVIVTLYNNTAGGQIYNCRLCNPSFIAELEDTLYYEQAIQPQAYIERGNIFVFWGIPLNFTGNMVFKFIKYQPNTTPSNTNGVDILLSPKYDDKIVDIMIQRYEAIKQRTL